jgi:hypothetical protein
MAVPVTPGESLTFETPTQLFEFRLSGNLIFPYSSASLDGQRFLLSTVVDLQENAPLTVVQNWQAEIKR